MNKPNWENCSVQTLIKEFFEQDDIKKLAEYTGILLDCPLLIIDETFHIAAHFSPPDFSDKLFKDAVSYGMITYEIGAIISKNDALCAGKADYIKLDESIYKRRFAPLISTGVRLGYLICVDNDGHLQKIPMEIWQQIEMILSKQLFIETSRTNHLKQQRKYLCICLAAGSHPNRIFGFKRQTPICQISSRQLLHLLTLPFTITNMRESDI